MKKALAFRNTIYSDSGSPLLFVVCHEISSVAVRSTEGGENYLKTFTVNESDTWERILFGGERKGDNVIQSRL